MSYAVEIKTTRPGRKGMRYEGYGWRWGKAWKRAFAALETARMEGEVIVSVTTKEI